jgi:hypothetical protein
MQIALESVIDHALARQLTIGEPQISKDQQREIQIEIYGPQCPCYRL